MGRRVAPAKFPIQARCQPRRLTSAAVKRIAQTGGNLLHVPEPLGGHLDVQRPDVGTGHVLRMSLIRGMKCYRERNALSRFWAKCLAVRPCSYETEVSIAMSMKRNTGAGRM